MRSVIAAIAAAAVLLGLQVPSAAAVVEPATIWSDSAAPGVVFSPNGDGQEDDYRVTVCLDRAANVTAAVLDAEGELVDTLWDEVSVSGGCHRYYWTDALVWDGRAYTGDVVEDGTYTIELTALNGSGTKSTASREVRVDTRIPGTLLEPTPGAVLSGTVDWAFRATAGFPGIQAVAIGGQCGSPQSTAADDDGVFHGTLDTLPCGLGARTLSAGVQYVDESGAWHSWSSPDVSVELDNPVAPSPMFTQDQVETFSPNGDGQEDTTTVSYCIADNDGGQAHSVIVVRDEAGDVVRTLLDNAADWTNGTCWPWYWTGQFTTWDGLDADGSPVPDGQYSVEIISTDQTGLASEPVTRPLVVDRRTPGALVTPAAGDVVEGTLDWAFEPDPDFPGIRYVQLNTPCGGGSAESPDGDGRYAGTVDVSCFDGDATVSASVGSVDDFGRWHYWTAPVVAVALDNPRPPEISITSWGLVFSPDGDGQDDAIDWYRCARDTDAGTLRTATRVLGAAGEVVRDLGTDERPSETCGWWSWGVYQHWDGTDDAGDAAPDGDYTIEIVTTDAGGLSSTRTLAVSVDTRAPGILITPADGSTLSGTVDWEFVPTEGFDNIGEVFASGGACGSATSATADEDGHYRGTIDTTGCREGPTTLNATVYYTDRNGWSHWWQGPRRTVHISNPAPPVASILRSGNRQFSPDGDNQEDQLSFYYCATDTDASDLALAVQVLDASGELVRTVAELESNGASGCSPGLPYWYWPYTSWDGMDDDGHRVSDGDYTVALVATDAGGLSSTSDPVDVRVDTRVPGTLVTPTAGGTLAGSTRFRFVPTSEIGNVNEVSVSFAGVWRSIYNASPDGSWRTTYPVGSLASGPTNLTWSVTWTDEFGQQHNYSRTFEVAVDPVSVPLEATLTPPTGQFPLATELRVRASDPNGVPLNVRVDFGDGTVETATMAAPYDDLVRAHTYERPGSFNVFVSVSNGTGGYAAQTIPVEISGPPNEPPTVSTSTTPLTGSAPLDTVTAVTATDVDDDPLTYRVDFGDGSAIATGPLPTAGLPHRYARPGRFLMRIEVSDGSLSVVRWHRVVAVLDEPVVASAGDDLRVPVGQAVGFDAGGSRPGALIDSWAWSFGDGGTAAQAAPSHVFTSPGRYKVRLTVGVGSTHASDEAVVEVFTPPPARGFEVTVTGAGSPLPGAEVTVVQPDGTRLTAVAGSDGKALVTGLGDTGAVTAYVWADGYRPDTAAGTLDAGRAEGAVDLVPGEAGAVTLDSHPMTYEEIIDSGIDVADPENSHVYEAEIHLYFVPETEADEPPPVDEVEAPPVTVVITEDRVYCTENCGTPPPGGGGDGAIYSGDSQWLPSVQYVEDHPVIQWLVLPMRASWLKEFFNVEMVVQNLTTGFSFESGAASLTLPAGLSLAPTATGQSTTVEVAPIPGGRSRSISWLVRGDVEGEYDLSVDYLATVQPSARSLHLSGRSASPLKVWGGSALETKILVDEHAVRWAPYGVDIEVTNISTVPVYNFQVEMLDRRAEAPDDQADFFYAPSPPQVSGTAEIAPGATWRTSYVVYPGLGNDQVTELRNLLEHSFVQRTGGDVDLAPTLGHRTGAPLGPGAGPVDVTATEDGKGELISWTRPAAPDGDTVVGYQVWARQSLRGGAWYPLLEVPSQPNGKESTTVPSTMRAVGRYLAVGTEYASGELRFQHRLGVGLPRYVALGDSYSSGEGVPAFDPGTASDVGETGGNKCHRSARGTYSRILADDRSLAGLEPAVFHACSGAVSADFTAPNGANANEPAQIDWLNDFTDVVTMTLGGNDIGFSDIGEACVLLDCAGKLKVNEIIGSEPWLDMMAAIWDEESKLLPIVDAVEACANPLDLPRKLMCAYKVNKAITSAQDLVGDLVSPERIATPRNLHNGILRTRLVATYRQVLAKAPHATVLVGGYPQLVTEGGAAACNLGVDLGVFLELSRVERTGIRRLVDQLNGVIREAVATVGSSRIQYVDPSGTDSAFVGEELCSGETLNPGSGFNSVVDPYFNAVTNPANSGPVAYSFHPNATGQRAYAATFARALSGRLMGLVTARPGAETAVGSRLVPYGARSLRIESSWPGSTVTLRLRDPSGNLVDLGAEGVSSGSDDTSQWVEIADPAPGSWSVAIFGDDVAETGEPTQVTTSVDEPRPAAAVARAAFQVDEDAGITFSAAGSTGTGELTYRWTFSDGGVATGLSVRHEFPARVGRWAMLEVRDDNGSAWDSAPVPDANRAPVASPAAYSTPEDTPIEIEVPAEDLDDDPLTITVDDPGHGTATVDGSTITYTPDADFAGDDAIPYGVADGLGESDHATLQLHVLPVNDRPSVVPASLTVVSGESASILLRAADVDGDPISWQVTGPPSTGTAQVSGATLTYASVAGRTGTAAVGLTASDGHGGTAALTVPVTILEPGFSLGAPTVSAELQPFRVRSTLSVPIRWGSSPEPSGTTYVVRCRRAGGLWTTWLTGTTAHSAGFGPGQKLVGGATYEIEVRGTDPYGRSGPPGTARVRVPLDDRAASRSGAAWRRTKAPGRWLGTTTSTSRGGARLTFQTTGKSLVLFGDRRRDGMRFKVLVNGRAVGTYSAAGRAGVRTPLWSRSFASSAHRSITVVTIAGKRRSTLAIDGLEVGS